MTKKLKNESITPIVVMSLITISPIIFYIIMPLIYSGYYSISAWRKERSDEYKQFIEDEKLYGTGFDKPIIENFRPSSMSAKALCISKGKESLNTLLNQNREVNDELSQYSDLIEKAREINEDNYKNLRVNVETQTPYIKREKPIYDFIPSVYAKIENRFIECEDQGSTGYGNKSLGLKIGEICEFMPHIQYTRTQLIPDKNSIGDPNWNATVVRKYYLYDSFPYDCKI